MGVGEALRVLVKHWILILVCVLVPVAVAFGMSATATPVYSATATSFVSLSFGKSPAELTQGSQYVKGQLESYARLAKTPVVLEPVIDELDLDTTAQALSGKVSTSIPGDTSMINVKVSDTSPELAADIANAVATQMVTAAQGLSPKDANGDPSVIITTVEEATPPSAATSPKPRRNIMLAAFAGLLLGVGASFLRSSMDTRVGKASDVSTLAKAPLLAEIPTNGMMGRGRSVLADAAQGEPTLEQYRRLRANLRFVAIGKKPLILSISSAVAGEGKTTVVTNLALTCARGGDRTLVIDADLRKQRMSSLFGVEGAVGLTGVLTGQVSFADAVQSVRTSGGPLSVLPAGELPPNPVELLGSKEMRELVASISDDYDVIIIDTPAVVPVVDAAVVAEWSSGTLLVARAGYVHRKDLEAAVASIQRSGASVLGVVVNGVKLTKKNSYYGNDSGKAKGRSAQRGKERGKAGGRGAAAKSKNASAPGAPSGKVLTGR